MSFLQPLMLLGLIGALVPILIHLIHRRKPRRQPFAAIEFVLRSVERVENRWRLKRWLLLASRVLLLAALAIAAARPLLGAAALDTARSSGPERLAIVLDASLSMRQQHEDRTAFARAVTGARNLVDKLGPEDQAILIIGTDPPIAIPERPTASRSELLAALDEVEPGFGYVDLSVAVTAAARALAPASESQTSIDPDSVPKQRVVLLTDLAGHGFRSAADLGSGDSSTALDIVDVLEDIEADERNNRAITELDVSGIPGEAPRTMEARARIRAFSTEAGKKGEAEIRSISLRNALQEELTQGSVEVVEGTVVDKSLVFAFEQPGFIPVSIELEHDRLIEDDIRHAIADVRHEVRTLIIDGAPSGVPKEDEIFYLERALVAGARDQPAPQVITADDLRRTDLNSFDVVMLVGVPSLGPEDAARLIEYVEGGKGLLISACEDLDIASYNAELGRALPRKLRGLKVVDADAAGSSGPVALSTPDRLHPITAVFEGEATEGLTSARTHSYLLLEPGAADNTRVILSYEDGQPALIEGRYGTGRVLLLTTSLDRDLSDLPIRPGFLPLMRRALLYLGDALAPPIARQTLVGESKLIRAPTGARALEVVRPDGKVILVDVPSGAKDPELSFDQSDLPGAYRVRVRFGADFDDHPELAFAVNVDPRESDLRPVSVSEATAVLRGSAPGAESSSRLRALAGLADGGFSSPENLAALLLLISFVAFALESALTMQRRRPSA